MSREKIKTYRYSCDGMMPVTHAPDGREWGIPMCAPCTGEPGYFPGADHYEADRAATAAGWRLATPGGDRCPGPHSADPWDVPAEAGEPHTIFDVGPSKTCTECRSSYTGEHFCYGTYPA